MWHVVCGMWYVICGMWYVHNLGCTACFAAVIPACQSALQIHTTWYVVWIMWCGMWYVYGCVYGRPFATDNTNNT